MQNPEKYFDTVVKPNNVSCPLLKKIILIPLLNLIPVTGK